MTMVKKPRQLSWKEARRFQAYSLRQEGWNQKDIAYRLGVSQSAVCQWLKSFQKQGLAGLLDKERKGARPKLTADQVEALIHDLRFLRSGLRANRRILTYKTIAYMIYALFNVRYHPSHVYRLLKRHGW